MLTGGFIGNNPNVSTATGRDGRFGFQNLRPGDYFILVRKQGYELNQALEDPMPAVVLLPNQAVSLQLRLVAEASIAGRIVDETTRPLSGISVRGLADGPVVQEIRAKVITNEHGEYRLSRLIPGRYRVITTSIYFSRSTFDQQLTGYSLPKRSYRETFYPGTVDPKAATSLDVVAGAHFEHMDFALDGGKWNQVRGRIRLTVRQVVGPTRSPSLRLLPRVPQTSRQPYGYDVQKYGLDREYPFVVRGVMPGLYDLRVTWHYQGEEYTSQTEVSVGSSDLENVVLEVGPRVKRRFD